MTSTRRQWLLAAATWSGTAGLRGADKEFWESKDPATWSTVEKEALLWKSPWARDGFARMEEKKRSAPHSAPAMPDTSPGLPPGGLKSVPIGEKIPLPPKPGGEPIQFQVLARWESAEPVRLAGGLDVSELTGQYYVLRLRGLPLMPPPKVKPGETAPDPNEAMVQAIQAGSRLERKDKPAIACSRLFTGSDNGGTDVLLLFPREGAPITIEDKTVTLESRFAVFHLSIKFQLKDMLFKGQLAL